MNALNKRLTAIRRDPVRFRCLVVATLSRSSNRVLPMGAAGAAKRACDMVILCLLVGGLAILSAFLQVAGIIPKPPVGMRKGDLPVLLVGLALSAWLGKGCAEARNPPPAERPPSAQFEVR